MWWCCGKTKESAPGCLFRKHVCKEEDGDLDSEKGKFKQKRLKCTACRELGHLIAECPRDPNIKTNKDPEEEMKRITTRITKPSDNFEAQKLTQNMLKRLTLLGNERLMLNMLTFDDYNYEAYNKKLLDLKLDLESDDDDDK